MRSSKARSRARCGFALGPPQESIKLQTMIQAGHLIFKPKDSCRVALPPHRSTMSSGNYQHARLLLSSCPPVLSMALPDHSFHTTGTNGLLLPFIRSPQYETFRQSQDITNSQAIVAPTSTSTRSRDLPTCIRLSIRWHSRDRWSILMHLGMSSFRSTRYEQWLSPCAGSRVEIHNARPYDVDQSRTGAS